MLRAVRISVFTHIMTQAMKNSIFRGSAALLILAAAFLISGATAQAQVYPTTCPSATVFYPNGYSMSPCVPSYPQGYPNITIYPGNGGPYSGGYQNGPFTAIQTNPFTNPMYSNTGAFAPGMIQTGPTYYYPPAPAPIYPYGYNGNPFYNTPGNGYYGGGYQGGNNGMPYGNDLWINNGHGWYMPHAGWGPH